MVLAKRTWERVGERKRDRLIESAVPHYSKMALVNKNKGLKEEYPMEQDLFS